MTETLEVINVEDLRELLSCGVLNCNITHTRGKAFYQTAIKL